MTDTTLTIPQLTKEVLARAELTSAHEFFTIAGVDNEGDALKSLQKHEANATGKMRASKRIFTEAILHLHEIRERKLWLMSGQPSWTAYLEHWCEDENFSVSSAFKFLSLVKIWSGGLGRDVAELPEHADGVYTVLPLIDESKDKPPMIAQYDPETGEIISIRSEWADTIPSAGTPQERVRAWVDGQIDEDDTIHNIRRKMRKQVSSSKEQNQNGSQTDHGRLAVRLLVEMVGGEKQLRDITWELWQNGKKVCEGIGVSQLNKNPRARELFCQMMGHSW